jgi:AhpD family alkylhydroperoxidase
MEPQINLFTSEIAGKVTKRLVSADQVYNNGHGPVPAATLQLVEIRASQINGCGFCVDMHTKDAAAGGEASVRLHLIAAWREATVFTDAERAALALAEEGTRIADLHRGISADTWEQLRKHYDNEQIATLISAVAVINAFNRLNVMAGTPAGGYEPGMFD